MYLKYLRSLYPRIMIKNKIVVNVWSFVWRNRIDPKETVVFVRGWRSASIDRPSGRHFVSFIFDWEWKIKKRLGWL